MVPNITPRVGILPPVDRAELHVALDGGTATTGAIVRRPRQQSRRQSSARYRVGISAKMPKS